jgi:hypothetical protein
MQLDKSLGTARLSGPNWLERQAGRGLLKKATQTRLILEPIAQGKPHNQSRDFSADL